MVIIRPFRSYLVILEIIGVKICSYVEIYSRLLVNIVKSQVKNWGFEDDKLKKIPFNEYGSFVAGRKQLRVFCLNCNSE